MPFIFNDLEQIIIDSCEIKCKIHLAFKYPILSDFPYLHFHRSEFKMNEAANSKEEKKFLTLAEVQKYLGIKSRKTILKYIADGKLPAYKIGGTRWRIAYADVMAFLKKQFIELAEEKTVAREILRPAASRPQDEAGGKVSP